MRQRLGKRLPNCVALLNEAFSFLLLFFIDILRLAETPLIKTPLHSIIKLSPAAYGCREEEIIVPIDAVEDTKLG